MADHHRREHESGSEHEENEKESSSEHEENEKESSSEHEEDEEESSSEHEEDEEESGSEHEEDEEESGSEDEEANNFVYPWWRYDVQTAPAPRLGAQKGPLGAAKYRAYEAMQKGESKATNRAENVLHATRTEIFLKKAAEYAPKEAFVVKHINQHKMRTLVQHTVKLILHKTQTYDQPVAKPLYYLLEPTRPDGIHRNWLEKFEHAGSKETIILDMVGCVRILLHDLGGALLKQAYPGDSNTDRSSMKWILSHLEASLRDALSHEQIHEARLGTKVSYVSDLKEEDGNDVVFESQLTMRNGTRIEVSVWHCVPIMEGGFLHTQRAVRAVDSVMMHEKQTNLKALFVRICVKDQDDPTGKNGVVDVLHHLRLVPYQENLQPISLMTGSYTQAGRLWVRPKFSQTAGVPPHFTELERKHNKPARARVPFKEEEVMDVFLRHMHVIGRRVAERNSELAVACLVHDVDVPQEQFPGRMPVNTYFGSEDSMCFMMVTFDHGAVDFTTDFGTGDFTWLDKDEGMTSFMLLVIRYPVLGMSLSSSMDKARFEYFMNAGARGGYEAFKLWKRGDWDIGDPWPPEDPGKFYAVQGRHGLVYPHRMIHALPRNATYAHLFGRSDIRGHPFFVNDFEDDRNVFYMYRSDYPEHWDDLNLIRLQTQIKCSIAAVADRGQAFYAYRQTLPPGGPFGVFRQYLRAHPAAMRVWREEWDPVLHPERGVGRSFTFQRVGPKDGRAAAEMHLAGAALNEMFLWDLVKRGALVVTK
jgi:hypothetical protein